MNLQKINLSLKYVVILSILFVSILVLIIFFMPTNTYTKELQEGVAVNNTSVKDCSMKTTEDSCNNSYNSYTQNQCMWSNKKCVVANKKNDSCSNMTKDNCNNYGSGGSKCEWKDNNCHGNSKKKNNDLQPLTT